MSDSTNALALCSLANVKDFYGMSGSVVADDDLIEDLIDDITDMFEKYCGVTSFKATTYTEYYDGTGNKYLFVKNVPIISITSIHDDSDWNWTSTYLLDATEYRAVDSKYVVYQGVFSNADQAIKIVYRAGYNTIPGDLKLACIKEVTKNYKHRKDFDVLRKSLNDGTAEYVKDALMADTKLILDKYKAGYII